MAASDDGTRDGDGPGATVRPGSTAVHAPGVLVRVTPWAVIALAESADEASVLRGTAVDVWHAFARPARVADVANDLAAGYRSDGEEVLGAVLDVVRRLVDAGALELVRGGGR